MNVNVLIDLLCSLYVMAQALWIPYAGAESNTIGDRQCQYAPLVSQISIVCE